MSDAERSDTPSVAIIGTRGYPSFYGGFETAVRYLAPYLANQGWNVTVYGRVAAESASAGDPRIVVKRTPGLETKSLSTLSYGLTASLDAVRRKPDVALVMNVANGHFLPALHARGIPTLVNVDGIEWEREKWGRFARAVFLAGANRTAKYGDMLVFDAQAIARKWGERWGRTGVFIPYGGEPDIGNLPEPLGLETGTYVLAVARFVPENSIPEFLAAARDLGRGTPVVLVGSSGYRGHLEDEAARLAMELPNFRWLGHVKDDVLLHALWKHSGVYFHGHSVGGTNPALVQAMALGAPTLARDTVYNREVLGSTGEYWSKASQIAEKITTMLANPAKRSALSQSASERAAREYSWDLVCRRYEKALRELAGFVS